MIWNISGCRDHLDLGSIPYAFKVYNLTQNMFPWQRNFYLQYDLILALTEWNIDSAVFSLLSTLFQT